MSRATERCLGTEQALANAVNDARACTRFAVPDASELSAVDEMAELHQVLITRNQIQAKIDSGGLLPLCDVTSSKLREALQIVKRAAQHFAEIVGSRRGMAAQPANGFSKALVPF